MTHDLDDAVRESLHRHAASAPADVDLDAVRSRAAALTRRRRLEVAGAVAAATVVVAGAAFGVASLSSSPTPPPVGTPTPTPSPTVAVAGLPWTAWTVTDPEAAPAATSVVVSVAGGPSRTVATISDAAVQVVAWVGPGRRTLVVQSGQDSRGLYAISFAPDGSVSNAFGRARVAGAKDVGHAFALPGGGFAWAWSALTGSAEWRVSDVSADDLAATTRPGRFTGEPLLVTGDYVVAAEGESTLRVYSATGSADLAVCPHGVAGITATSTGRAALTCQTTGAIHVVDLAAAAGGVKDVTDLPAAGPGEVRQLWFGPDGALFAALAPAGQDARPTTVTTRVWTDATRWTDASGPAVLSRVYAPGLALSLRPAAPLEVWTTDEDVPREIGPGDVDASFVPTLIARPAG